MTLAAAAQLDPRFPALLRRLQRFEHFAPYLKVRPEEGGRLVPLVPLPPQRYILAECARHMRVLILKARRMGVTTIRLGKGVHNIWKRKYWNSLMLAHRDPDAQEIFESAQIMDRELPDFMRHERATVNRREIAYSLMSSKMTIGTAGGLGVRRGVTLQDVHLTEVARFTGDVADTIAGIEEAARHGRIVGETTAAGASGWFYDTWMQCADDPSAPWHCVFAPWYIDERNRLPLTDEERADWTPTEYEASIGADVPPEAWAWYRVKERSRGALMRQEYPSTALEAFVVSGRHFFEQERLARAVGDLPKPIAFEDNRCTLIWEQPEPGAAYVIGADPADGTPSGDYSYASVHERESGRQVARYRGRCVPSEFADILARLGERYHRAFIGVERNRIETVRRLRKDLGYPSSRLFFRRTPSGKRDREPGWVTSAQTRPLMLDGLKAALEGFDTELESDDPNLKGDAWLEIRDRVFFAEAQAFEDQGGGRYAANPGAHDDSIFAIAIAVQMRKQPTPRVRSF